MTTPQQLDQRYGRRAPRRWVAIVGAVSFVAIMAVGLWWMRGSVVPTVDTNDLGYEIVDEHAVELRFSVTAPVGEDVICVLEAWDEEFGIVGWRMLELPASDQHTRGFTERILTVAPATTGLVNSCWTT